MDINNAFLALTYNKSEKRSLYCVCIYMYCIIVYTVYLGMGGILLLNYHHCYKETQSLFPPPTTSIILVCVHYFLKTEHNLKGCLIRQQLCKI